MLSVAALCLAGLAAAQGAVFKDPRPYGHAAFAYPPLHCTKNPCDVVPSCNKAHWADELGDFNAGNDGKSDANINIAYAYGGDIEFWAGRDTPDACWAPASTDLTKCNVSVFFDPNNAAAAQVYANAEGVDTIVALLDSRMDGWQQIQTYNDYDACHFGNFYPNLLNLTETSMKRLAEDTARLYCADDLVRGVQIDIEPYRDPYKPGLQSYMKYVSEALRDDLGQHGCRNDKYPNGRAVSYFTFAHNHQPSFTDILGPNGYYVFSGYDLYPKDDKFTYNNVTEYRNKLRHEIQFFRHVLGDKGKFSLAIPISASCHEYEQYVPMKGDGCGPACTGLTNQAKMHEYVQAVFDVILDPATTNATGGLFCLNETASTQFLGLSLWGFSFSMTYPPMKWFANDFFPPNPNKDALEVLRANLPKLSDGTTCLSPSATCTDGDSRDNGCPCTHSWQCKSDWCSGTCHDKPPTSAPEGFPTVAVA